MRTITMEISLLDCCNNNLEALNQKVYDKIYGEAKDLVSIGDAIARDFGVPIVNKKISMAPIALVGGYACKSPEDFASIARTFDKVAKDAGASFIGGYSALASKGMTSTEESLIRSIPQALASMERVCSSVNVGSMRTGLNMDAVRLVGEIIKETAVATKEDDSLDCARLVVFCNAPDDNPFMAGASHDMMEADAIINIGVSGPGVVRMTTEEARGENFEVLCETIKRTTFKIIRVGQLVARKTSKHFGVLFGIIDLLLAPTSAMGDNVAKVLERVGLERAGAPGTTMALAILSDQMEKGDVTTPSHVGGFSGAFIPVSGDQGMINAVTMGVLTPEKLEAMTCICSVGLDMIAIPGDTMAAVLAGTTTDEAAIGIINRKTTAAWLTPVIGEGVGGTVELGGLLGYASVTLASQCFCEKSVDRGGRIPVPIHNFKNQDGNRMKIYLIRYGWQCSRLYNANMDLCGEEYRQAEFVGRRLEHAGIEKLRSSDLLRVVQTAETANRYWNIEHVIRPELQEISLGDMEGFSDDVIAKCFTELKLRQNQILEDLPYPDGERAGDVIQRTMPILLEIAQSGLSRVAMVTHGDVIRSVTAGILEISLAKTHLIGSSLENRSVTELEYSPEGPLSVSERFNDYAHLEQGSELLWYH